MSFFILIIILAMAHNISTEHKCRTDYERLCIFLSQSRTFRLKEAFRIYDKDQQGYITTDTLKEILREIDNKLSEEDLEGIIEEVDEDGSGTLDFDGKHFLLFFL